MKYLPVPLGLSLILSMQFSAYADERLDGMKKMNADGCVESIKFEEHAPKDAKLVKPYCTCVYDTYFNGFSPAEQKQLFGGIPASGKLEGSLPARLESAKAQCRKKIGF
jgi:hypothetical protein